MTNRLRSLQPRTLLDVSSHLQFTRRPDNFHGYYQHSPEAGNYAWSPFDTYGWFEATKKMAGAEAKLDTRPHEYQTGTLDERSIGRLTIGDTSFNYDATAEASKAGPEFSNQVLTVVAAGVLRYLEGFDQQASNDIQRQLEAAVAEQKRSEADRMRELIG